MRFNLNSLVVYYSLISVSLFLPFRVQAEDSAILISVKGGGKNPMAFCVPELSIKNQSDTDIGALLIRLEWKNRKSGEILQPAGSFGTMIDKFSAGKVVSPLVTGHLIDCNNLELVIGTYACRDADAVRISCPGKIIIQPAGGITINTDMLKEGSMKGAVEPK